MILIWFVSKKGWKAQRRNDQGHTLDQRQTKGKSTTKEKSMRFPCKYTTANQKRADKMGMNSVNLTII